MADASASSPKEAGETPTPSTGGWWTLPIMCFGIALIACALIVGQVEDNLQMTWQKNKLQMDLEHLQKQSDTNVEFLERIKTDANLVERLAQRQMKLVREGAAVLELKGSAGEEGLSAFKLVKTPSPPNVEPYRSADTPLTRLFGTARQRLYASGMGAFLIAVGLIMGNAGKDQR